MIAVSNHGIRICVPVYLMSTGGLGTEEAWFNTFVENLLLYTTDSRILDRSVTTVHLSLSVESCLYKIGSPEYR